MYNDILKYSFLSSLLLFLFEITPYFMMNVLKICEASLIIFFPQGRPRGRTQHGGPRQLPGGTAHVRGGRSCVLRHVLRGQRGQQANTGDGG